MTAVISTHLEFWFIVISVCYVNGDVISFDIRRSIFDFTRNLEPENLCEKRNNYFLHDNTQHPTTIKITLLTQINQIHKRINQAELELYRLLLSATVLCE